MLLGQSEQKRRKYGEKSKKALLDEEIEGDIIRKEEGS
jgi:hypothetical protein